MWVNFLDFSGKKLTQNIFRLAGFKKRLIEYFFSSVFLRKICYL